MPIKEPVEAPGENSPERYPYELAGDVTTNAGLHLYMRPIRPDDAQGLVIFHHSLTADSVYRRYFSMHPTLSERELEHLTRVDYRDRLALVVLERGQIIAVGRYDRIQKRDEAEVAFLVADKLQHHGIGLLLLQHLADAALAQGITIFTAETQMDNRGMIGVFEGSGFPVTLSVDGQMVSVRFPIQPTDASRAVRDRNKGDREC